jgi:hypothetical protein
MEKNLLYPFLRIKFFFYDVYFLLVIALSFLCLALAGIRYITVCLNMRRSEEMVKMDVSFEFSLLEGLY